MSASFLDLHQRALQGEWPALEQLSELVLPLLRARLRRAFRFADDGVIADAVVDALLDYFKRPASFDSSRGVPLERFLYVAAWRNVSDSLETTARRRKRESEYARSVCARTRQVPGAYLDPARLEIGTLRILELAEGDAERQALRQWLSGERRSGALASTLGAGDASAEEQRATVKRFKDRIMKRVGRLVAQHRP